MDDTSLLAEAELMSGLGRPEAKQAVRATLETLAELLGPHRAQRMSLDEFVGRIAEREGVDYDEALEHARAVIATLREALPPKELSDLLAQLPRGYQEALLKVYEPAR